MTCRTFIGICALMLGAIPRPVSGAEEPYDLIVRNGRLVDGTGGPWRRGDLAIRGDRIAAMGVIPADAPTKRTIDAGGRMVSPGFIDAHSHSDMLILEDGSAQSKVRQGVTTDVLGESHSAGPSKGKRPAETVEFGGVTYRWSTLGGYLDSVDKAGVAINVASHVGMATVWECVMGDSFDRPTPAQFDEMKALIAEAMDEGAFGMSSMLASPPGLLATTDDVALMASAIKARDGLFSSHIRNEGPDVLKSIDEAIAVGEKAGVRVDVIHLKIADKSNWGRMAEVVARFEAARARGVDVQANVYPYTRGNNDLVTILPPWAHEGGKADLLKRLADPEARARMKRDIRGGIPGWYNHFTAVGGDWSRMLLSAKLSSKNQKYEGKTMDVILPSMAIGRNPAPEDLDLLFDFLIDEDGSIGTIYAHHTEEDMTTAMRQPWCSIGSDGSAMAIEGPLRRGHPHPRNFGTFPRVLGVYARERGVLRVEEAVRKMTSLNANKLGLTDRGLLRPGMYADVVVFDPDTVIDRSTFLEPFAYNEGIEAVIVNGVPVLEAGKPTGAKPGRALRKGR
ncbi:D-aminoacylase [Isosphaeraceae bacterium EP7]